LVGDGPEKENYEKLAIKLGISDRVVFTGYQNQIGTYYSIFDIFCLVSAHEAFGLVLVEAMLHKLPVLATNVGGMHYIVEDNKTGFLVEKFDVEAISNKLTILCDDVDVRTQFGENGYYKAIQNYTEERYVKNVEDLYIELIKKEKISEN
jgi:glycosyltransferase involved in cell wall biosynthesis